MNGTNMPEKTRRRSNCKRCGANEGFRRCHRTLPDRFLSLVRLYPFECNACGSIAYRLHIPATRRQSL